tara:strand:+ start:14902 stop:15960 length:1059 start_codon:yes stop_codon:yes gene_type:complete
MLKINFHANRKKIDTFPVPKNYDLIEKEKVLQTSIPIHLDGDLEKVKKVPFGITLEQELKEFNSKTYKSGPFYSYKLENVVLIKNRLYFGEYEYQLNPLENPQRIYNSNQVQLYENAAFSSMRISTVFFGHWLREELILIDYLQGKKDIVTSSPSTPQKKEIMNLFNLKCNVNSFAKISTADMYYGWQHSNVYKEILSSYKQKISLLPSIYSSASKLIVYLKRGYSASKRVLENEEKMLESLSKDFQVLSFIAESTPIEELYAALYKADFILSIEGSQMAHAIIAGKPKSTLICIQPPSRFYNPFKNYCSDADIGYAILVADEGLTKESFVVDIDNLKRLFDKVESKFIRLF